MILTSLIRLTTDFSSSFIKSLKKIKKIIQVYYTLHVNLKCLSKINQIEPLSLSTKHDRLQLLAAVQYVPKCAILHVAPFVAASQKI